MRMRKPWQRLGHSIFKSWRRQHLQELGRRAPASRAPSAAAVPPSTGRASRARDITRQAKRAQAVGVKTRGSTMALGPPTTTASNATTSGTAGMIDAQPRPCGTIVQRLPRLDRQQQGGRCVRRVVLGCHTHTSVITHSSVLGTFGSIRPHRPIRVLPTHPTPVPCYSLRSFCDCASTAPTQHVITHVSGRGGCLLELASSVR